MNALTLLIIRHAEKPDGDATGPGLTHEGKPDSKSLVIFGWERAGAWTALFGSRLGGASYPTPQAIYAADPDSSKDGSDPSRRPYETVLELAARVGLAKPDTSFAKGEEAGLVEALLALSGTALVAWEHKAIISDILPRLPVSNAGQLPPHWSGKRFDVVLRFDRAAGEADFKFTELYPCLMLGDSNKPLQSAPKDE
ncbi:MULTISPECIES: histidine phosphatase family protein [unclassified Bradyrhizobium]|uniref:histidine phosphatase family protein n=1 Tax=unclassified Bradyrhizobium TaxID=2631580 RepID=UPI002916B5A4|nr:MULTISPECIES: histidine phosphatase family protein [unclassified Bradyrhizobium]